MENQPTPTQVDKMAEIQAKIDRLEAEIEDIKNVNPNWASDAGVLAAIAAKDNRIAGLEAARLASGKLPINIHIAF
jgi:archaellum component FlaC